MIAGGNISPGYETTDSFSRFVKKSYILTIVSIVTAIYEWHFLRAYVRYDVSKYSALLMMIAFILTGFFHAIPKIRIIYPANYFFMLTTQELMILAAAAMFIQASFNYLIIHTLLSLFIFICLMIIGEVLQRNFKTDPFRFTTIVFINFMTVTLLIYFHLTMGNASAIIIINFITLYTLFAVLIYHSMVLHNEESTLHDEDYMLMGLLLFVDYICLFTIGILFNREMVEKSRNYCFCGDAMDENLETSM